MEWRIVYARMDSPISSPTNKLSSIVHLVAQSPILSIIPVWLVVVVWGSKSLMQLGIAIETCPRCTLLNAGGVLRS